MSGLRSFTDLQCQIVREAGGGRWGVNMSGLRSFTDLQCQTVRAVKLGKLRLSFITSLGKSRAN